MAVKVFLSNIFISIYDFRKFIIMDSIHQKKYYFLKKYLI